MIVVGVLTLQNENEVAGCPARAKLYLDPSKKFWCAIVRWGDQIMLAHDTSQRASKEETFFF